MAVISPVWACWALHDRNWRIVPAGGTMSHTTDYPFLKPAFVAALKG